jgi:hypothetical protein
VAQGPLARRPQLAMTQVRPPGGARNRSAEEWSVVEPLGEGVHGAEAARAAPATGDDPVALAAAAGNRSAEESSDGGAVRGNVRFGGENPDGGESVVA